MHRSKYHTKHHTKTRTLLPIYDHRIQTMGNRLISCTLFRTLTEASFDCQHFRLPAAQKLQDGLDEKPNQIFPANSIFRTQTEAFGKTCFDQRERFTHVGWLFPHLWGKLTAKKNPEFEIFSKSRFLTKHYFRLLNPKFAGFLAHFNEYKSVRTLSPNHQIKKNLTHRLFMLIIQRDFRGGRMVIAARSEYYNNNTTKSSEVEGSSLAL